MAEARNSQPYKLQTNDRTQWLPQGIVGLYLLAALAAYIFIPLLATGWLNRPFLGAFVEQTMSFNGVNSSVRPSGWTGYNQGLNAGVRLIQFDGKPVHNSFELSQALSQHQVGDSAVLTVASAGKANRQVTVALMSFPWQDQLTFLIFPYAIGLIYLFSAFWVFAIRRAFSSGRAYTMFAVSVALVTGALFDLYTTQRLTYLWSFGLACGGAAIVDLALRFPRKEKWLERFPLIGALPYAAAVGLFGFTFFTLFNFQQPVAYIQAWKAELIFSGTCLALAVVWFVVRRFRSSSPVESEQIRLTLIGSVASFGVAGIWYLGTPFWLNVIPFSPYLMLPLMVFPIATGYAIQRYRLLNSDFILSRLLMYGLMAVLISIGYAMLVTGLGLILKGYLPADSVVLNGIIIFIIAIIFVPLRNSLEKSLDAVFLRGEKAYRERLQTFSGELTSTVDITQIIRILRDYVNKTLMPGRLHIFVYDPLSEQYVPTNGDDGRPTTDIRFMATSPLVQIIQSRRSSLFLDGGSTIPEMIRADQSRIQLMAAQIFIPLPGRQRLAGWMALGPRQTGEVYTPHEITFVEALNDQAALAIERAQVVQNMENRVREMNVLARVAEGINITLKLDDILELIYAQTTQIIRADDFHILLFDRETGALMEIFYVEENERLNQYENLPVEGGQTLEQEIIRQRRSILTDDYARECQQRGILTGRTDIFAWMGVPLNAGAETIGSLSMAKRDPAGTFTREQLNLLQAISDQVAGAIVKARLLEETERRARQLATLNEVTRQLSSTLEPEPLLQSILQAAVDILESEAGSLLMVDEQTDELVFKVTVGPVADDLINRRLPMGSGVVGKAVTNRHPVIVNNAQTSTSWFSKTDQQTGFTTRALLAVPLLVKDRAIGVIEVINKRDGSQFIRDDEDLLSAFAAQASVAMENARLYTMTDQALAARVEELSVMQRIDRELNASLDTTRTMQITLEWAMRQAHTTAGMVGPVGEAGMQITVSQGYSDELSAYPESWVSLQKFRLQEVVDSGAPLHLLVGKDIPRGILQDGRWMMIVPIRRETDIMGLLLLETQALERISDDTLNFLLRLSDHAAIAISNAQLYAAVQAANVAKSEFVSFVSHELKNPMTSIKGYSELLAKGAVGPINDAQANFLATIRSNVERMATLVSDLADLSRIEAGRLKLDFKSLKLSDIVDEVGRSLQRQIDEKNQKLIVQLPAELPTVWADRMRVVQVVTNLVSNAYKYTPSAGMIFVAAEDCENRWDPEGVKRVVHVWVQDTGIGINPEDQKKIFQKFFRSEDAETRKAPGTGLGLNITRSLVEMQGGKIWFESEFRKGTIFHITIPVAE